MDDNGKKLTAAIRLYVLNGKGHFLKDAIKEIQGIVRSPAGIDPQDTITGTVVHGGILIQAGSNFAGIHLHPLTGNRALVTCEVAFAAICYQRLYQMVAKNQRAIQTRGVKFPSGNHCYHLSDNGMMRTPNMDSSMWLHTKENRWPIFVTHGVGP